MSESAMLDRMRGRQLRVLLACGVAAMVSGEWAHATGSLCRCSEILERNEE
jgi:hypothetical protein